MRHRLKLAFALITASGLLPGLAVGDAANTGDALAWKYHCVTCHGEQGRSNASRYPNLAGLPAPYIEGRLKYFRSRSEPGNQMNAQAAPLSDPDIATLADHYSRMPVLANPARSAPELALQKGCTGCHGADGISLAPIYPNLRGQWTRYLRMQLFAYRSGKRQNAIMNGFAASLSDDEIRALAAHYGED